jgi:large subunit ribosomal protein L9
MKVLLTDDVKGLGWLGDVIQVSQGYARNYLLPQGLAKRATDANIKAIAKAKAERVEQRLKDRTRLQDAAQAVGGAEAVLAARANEQGVLFGSITKRQIAANLREQGFEVPDDAVQLTEHIKHIGTHTVTLKFTPDLTVEVNVTVVAEESRPTGTQTDEGAGPRETIPPPASS